MKVIDGTGFSPYDMGQAIGGVIGGPLSGVPFTTVGNSFHVPDGGQHRAGFHYTQLMQTRLGMGALTTKAVGGTRAGQIAINTYSIGKDTSSIPKLKHFYGVTAMGNNFALGDTPQNRKTVEESLRTILASITAHEKIPVTTANFTFSSTDNIDSVTSSNAMSGKLAKMRGKNDWCDVSINGDAVDLAFLALAAEPGVVRFTSGGKDYGILNISGGVPEDPTVFVKRIRGLGSGSHVVRMTLESGVMYISGALIPSTAPSAGYVVTEATPDLKRMSYPGLDIPAIRDRFAEIERNVVKEFPSFSFVSLPLEYWNPQTMSVDGLHGNDEGQQFFFGEVVRQVLSSLTYTIGLGHRITTTDVYPADYVAATPPTTGVANGSQL